MIRLTLEIPDQIADAISVKFGYTGFERGEIDERGNAAQTEVKQAKEDFIGIVVSEFLKKNAGEHLGAEAAATAERTAIEAVNELTITHVKERL